MYVYNGGHGVYMIIVFNWIFVALFEMSMKSGAYYLLALFFFYIYAF